MTDAAPDYKPVDLRENTDVGHPMADSVQWVTVPGEDKVFLYLWNTDTDTPVMSVVGFDEAGLEKLQNWITNVTIEAKEAPFNEFGSDGDVDA